MTRVYDDSDKSRNVYSCVYFRDGHYRAKYLQGVPKSQAHLSHLCHRFHDDKSMAEATASLRFAPYSSNSFFQEINQTRQIYTTMAN